MKKITVLMLLCITVQSAQGMESRFLSLIEELLPVELEQKERKQMMNWVMSQKRDMSGLDLPSSYWFEKFFVCEACKLEEKKLQIFESLLLGKILPGAGRRELHLKFVMTKSEESKKLFGNCAKLLLSNQRRKNFYAYRLYRSFSDMGASKLAGSLEEVKERKNLCASLYQQDREMFERLRKKADKIHERATPEMTKLTSSKTQQNNLERHRRQGIHVDVIVVIGDGAST